MSTTEQMWTRERQSQAWTARSDGHNMSGEEQDAALAEIERAWGEIERLSTPVVPDADERAQTIQALIDLDHAARHLAEDASEETPTCDACGGPRRDGDGNPITRQVTVDPEDFDRLCAALDAIDPDEAHDASTYDRLRQKLAAQAEERRAYLDGRRAADEAFDKIRSELGALFPGKGPYPMLEAARAEIDRLTVGGYHPEVDAAIDGVAAAAAGVGPSLFERAVTRLLGMLSKHRPSTRHAPTSVNCPGSSDGSTPLTDGVDRAALATWLRAIAAGEIDITPDVESLLTAMSAALNRQRRTAPLTEARGVVSRGVSLREARGGLYRKFIVERADGSSSPGCKHERCDYLVLDWTHDPFAVPAGRAYADACESEYPTLAADIRARADAASRGDIPAEVRPAPGPCDVCEGRGWVNGSEVSQAVCKACGGTGKPAGDGAAVTTTPGHAWQRDASGESVLVPTLTHEEARERLVSVVRMTPQGADRILDRPKHAIEHDGTTEPVRDILRAYVAGLDTPPPVDVPHDIRLDKLSRFAGAEVGPTPDEEKPYAYDERDTSPQPRTIGEAVFGGPAPKPPVRTKGAKPAWLEGAETAWEEDDAGTPDRERIADAWRRIFRVPLPDGVPHAVHDAGDTTYTLWTYGRVAVSSYCGGAILKLTPRAWATFIGYKGRKVAPEVKP